MTVQKHVYIGFEGGDITIVNEELRRWTLVQTTMSNQDARDTLEACGFEPDILIVLDPNKVKPKGDSNA